MFQQNRKNKKTKKRCKENKMNFSDKKESGESLYHRFLVPSEGTRRRLGNHINTIRREVTADAVILSKKKNYRKNLAGQAIPVEENGQMIFRSRLRGRLLLERIVKPWISR